MPGGDSLAQAYVQILPTTKGLKGNLEKELGGAGGSAGDRAGSLFAGGFSKAAMAGLAAAGVAIGKSLYEGAALEQSLGGVETLYKNHANIVIENANNAWKTAGLSANDYMEESTMFAASLLQSLGGDTKKAAEYADMAIVDMSDNANKMGTSITDIQNAYQGFAKQNYSMLDNLKLGYGGNKTEMERLLSDAEKLSGQKYDISNLNDVYDAIHVVQEELGITGTTSKEASSTLAGSFASMKSAADNFLGNLTMRPELVAQSLNELVSATSTFLFDNLVPAIGNIFSALPTVISTFIQQGIPQIMTSIQTLMNSLMTGIGDNIDFMSKILPMITNFTKQLPKIAGGLVKAGMGLLQKLAEGIAKGIPVLIQNIPQIVINIANAINQNAPIILKGALNIMITLASGLIKAIPVLVQNIPKIFEAILAAWQALGWLTLGKVVLKGITKGLAGIAKVVVAPVKRAFNSVKTAIMTPINAARAAIGRAVSKIKSLMSFSGLKSKVQSIFNSIKQKITDPINKAKVKVSKAIKKIKGFFPIKVGKILSGISLPKFTLSTGSKTFMGKTIKYPTGLSVSWHAKAMEQPYMFNGATLFGAGEAGDEVLYGRRSLMKDIAEATGGGTKSNTFYVTLNASSDESPEEYAQRFAREMKRLARMGAI